MNELKLLPNPCNSCPYRKDTPPGIWDRSEYDKLPQWDNQTAICGTFLCHNDENRQTVCRGWLEVHHRNFSVRIACSSIAWNEANKEPCTVPLYKSGRQARLAGLRGVKAPSAAARIKIQRLAAKKQK